MTPKTTFRIEPGVSAPGWVARRVPEVGGPAGTFLGAGKSPDRPGAMRRRARTRWYCRTMQHDRFDTRSTTSTRRD